MPLIPKHRFMNPISYKENKASAIATLPKLQLLPKSKQKNGLLRTEMDSSVIARSLFKLHRWKVVSVISFLFMIANILF